MDHLLTPEQVKSRELEILKYVDAFCKKHGLTYFLSYGSLLGAVRHKGFIPWDDDIDISMLRPDYERFMHLVAQEEDPRFKAMLPGRKDYPYHFIKIVDSQTELLEDELDYPGDMGLWIDVFPLDGCSANGLSVSERLAHLFQECRAAATYKALPEQKSNRYLVWRLCRLAGAQVFKKLTIHYSRKGDSPESEYVAHTPTAFKFRFPRDLFKEVSEVVFEGCRFPAPKDYDQYLSILYGDYMTLPPEDKRENHSVKARLKQ